LNIKLVPSLIQKYIIKKIVEVEIQVHAFLPMALDGVSAWLYTSLYAHVRSPWYPYRVDPGCLVE
jgi:uncharacterized membrane protein